MRIFRPRPWAWIAAGLAVVLFGALGAWQWGRGEDKLRRVAAFETAAAQAPVVLAAGSAVPPDPGFRRAQATGSFLADRQLLADGQSHNRQPGYHVWTPMRLADGGLLIVNRGWVPQPAPEVLPAPAGTVTVTGYWRRFPRPGVRLETPACKADAAFPVVVVYPTAAETGCRLGEPVMDGVLLLDPDAPGGFVRDWSAPGFPPERHFAYAVQWWLLAATAIVLFILLNLKRP